jgi:hypothetical protein
MRSTSGGGLAEIFIEKWAQLQKLIDDICSVYTAYNTSKPFLFPLPMEILRSEYNDY